MRSGRAVLGACGVLEPDARLCKRQDEWGTCEPRECSGERGWPTFDVERVSRGACAERAGGVDEEFLWGLSMAETLDYHHHTHLIEGFGSAESYAFRQIHVKRLGVDQGLAFHE